MPNAYDNDAESNDSYGNDSYSNNVYSNITILQLALYRGAGKNDDGSINGGAIEAVGLPFFGGCEVCGASIVAYNACPSRSGSLRCMSGCIEDAGYETVEEANRAIFPEEYVWKGPFGKGVSVPLWFKKDGPKNETIPQWKERHKDHTMIEFSEENSDSRSFGCWSCGETGDWKGDVKL